MSGGVVGGAGWMGVPGDMGGFNGLRRLRPARVEAGRRRRVERQAARTAARLDAWADRCERPYVSYSGGKDSTVLLHIADRVLGDAVDAIYIADEEPGLPEVEQMREWWATQGRDVAVIVWGSFFAAYRAHGLEAPTIDRAYVRAVTRKVRARGYDGCARGLRAEESNGRYMHARCNGPGPRHRSGLWDLDPMLEWTADDVWAYHALHGLPYVQSYDLDDGQPRNRRRIGTLWGTSAAQVGRIVRLKRFYPEHYRRFAAEFPEVRQWS